MATAKMNGEREERSQTSGSNAEKNPDDWVTGEEPMTGAQASYLKTLSDEVGENFDPNLTKAQASKRIDELRSRDPRLQQSKSKKG